MPPDREALLRQSVRDELRDALDDAIRRAYCTPLYPPRPEEDPEIVRSIATAAILTDPTAMRHLERIQAAAWAAVEARVEEPEAYVTDACPRCHGDGEVGFNDSRNPRDHQHDEWARCPDCHGTGELTEDDDA